MKHCLFFATDKCGLKWKVNKNRAYFLLVSQAPLWAARKHSPCSTGLLHFNESFSHLDSLLAIAVGKTHFYHFSLKDFPFTTWELKKAQQVHELKLFCTESGA